MKNRILTALTALIFILATTPFALATDYGIEMVVPDGKKTRETDVVLRINQTNLEVIPDKKDFSQHAKNFKFSDITAADYSYAKKPMLSGGGAVAVALLTSVFLALPFLFVKKKTHWLSVQTDKDFVVLKLDNSNFRPIIAELKVRGAKVVEVTEENKLPTQQPQPTMAPPPSPSKKSGR